MKQVLIFEAGKEVFQFGKVEKGVFENDPSRETYRVTTDNGDKFYAVTEGFTAYDVESIPVEVEPFKYCYEPEKGFYKNPNYKEYKPVEQEIEELKETIAAQDELLAMLLLNK